MGSVGEQTLRIAHLELNIYELWARGGITTDTSETGFVGRRVCLTIFLNHLQKNTSASSRGSLDWADRC